MNHPDEYTIAARFAKELANDPTLTASQLADQYEYLANGGQYTYSRLEQIAQRIIDARSSVSISRQIIVNDDLPLERKLYWADLTPRTFKV
jgi:hypothetical protein